MIFKYCPDCGSRCKQTDFKRFVCAQCNHKFYDEPVAAAGGLIKNHNNKYLFIRRNTEPYSGSLSIPGGCVDNGESLEECFRRESLEEAGVNITDIKYYSSYPAKNVRYGQDETGITVIFTAETTDPGKSDKEEVSDIYWLGKNEVDINQIKSPDVKAFIKDFLRSG